MLQHQEHPWQDIEEKSVFLSLLLKTSNILWDTSIIVNEYLLHVYPFHLWWDIYTVHNPDIGHLHIEFIL